MTYPSQYLLSARVGRMLIGASDPALGPLVPFSFSSFLSFRYSNDGNVFHHLSRVFLRRYADLHARCDMQTHDTDLYLASVLVDANWCV